MRTRQATSAPPSSSIATPPPTAPPTIAAAGTGEPVLAGMPVRSEKVDVVVGNDVTELLKEVLGVDVLESLQSVVLTGAVSFAAFVTAVADAVVSLLVADAVVSLVADVSLVVDDVAGTVKFPTIVAISVLLLSSCDEQFVREKVGDNSPLQSDAHAALRPHQEQPDRTQLGQVI